MSHNENAALNEIASAAISVSRGVDEQSRAHGRYRVECVGADGKVRWVEEFDNVVTTVGKNDALDKHLAGSAYTATWYLGLMSSASYGAGAVVGDTSASHAGWTESTAYSNANRPTPSWGAASSGSKATTATAFNINASDTIKGCFLISNNTKGGATGILYSAGLFSGGDRGVINGDTLNVTYTASLT